MAFCLYIVIYFILRERMLEYNISTSNSNHCYNRNYSRTNFPVSRFEFTDELSL